MKVNLPEEKDCFNINPCDFCGEPSYLITPKIDAKWTKTNLHFRSIITDKKGEVLSCGFSKFFNFGERVDCYPAPEKYYDWKLEEKKDGTLVIVDYLNGQLNLRTRGTSTYKTQDNAKEFELLLEQYPKIKTFLSKNSNISLLFEMMTPSNVIVVRPKQVVFYLLNAIDKNNLKPILAENLLDCWREIGCPSVPDQYCFNETRDLCNIHTLIKHWKGKEGIVLSYNNGQNKIKFKSDWYLFLHRVKSQLSSTNNLVEYYVTSGAKTETDFFKKIESDYDFEIATQLQNDIDKICKAAKQVDRDIEGLKEFAQSLRKFENRKQQAEFILTTYGKCQKAAIIFDFLDNKIPDNNRYIKLIKQLLE